MTDQTQVIEHAARQGRDPRWRRFVTAMLGLLAASVAALGVVLIVQYGNTSDLRGQVVALSGQQAAAAHDAQQLAEQLHEHGLTPVVQPPTPVQGPVGPQGPGPSQQEIDDSVNRYFDAHPPGATPAMVAVQVAEYLTQHPPVTQDQITTAASDFIAAHQSLFTGPVGPTGVAGPTGQPGADATDAQVAAAVTAYCAAHSSCTGSVGPAGAQGVQGISVTDLVFQRDQSGTCQVVITLHDPATGTDTTITHPAGDAACPIAVPGLGNPHH